MGTLSSAIKGVRQGIRKGKLGKTMSEWFSGSRLNPGSWTEDIARGLGVRTRGKPNWVGGRAAINSGGKPYRGMGGAQTGSSMPAVAATDGHRSLTGAGYAAQAVGLGGAGTLGYKLTAGGDTPPRDANGVKNPLSSEELVKSREKFQMERMGGSKKFSAPVYEMVAKDSQWVKTAIESMGMDKYKKYRAAVIQDPSRASQLHDILVKELAKTGDSEMMKQAAKEAYVLPGLANVNGKKRVVVMNPSKNKDKQTSFQALQYDYEDEEGNE
jgi:hypothetical protein